MALMSYLPLVALAAGCGVFVGAVTASGLAKVGLRRTPGWIVGVCCSCAAIGGYVASGEPTSLKPVNIVLRCSLAVLVTFSCARARRSILVTVTGLLAVAVMFATVQYSATSLEIALALFGLGLTASGYLFPDRVPIFGALAGVCVSQSMLRLPTSLPGRSPSLVAGVAFVALVVSGYFNQPARIQRRIRRSAFALGAVGFGCAACGVISLVNARAQLQQGVARAQQGLTEARSGDIVSSESSFALADTSLGRAIDQLNSPLSQLGRVVPVLSQHLSVAVKLSAVGRLVVETAQEGVRTASIESLKVDGGRIDLQRVIAVREQVVSAERAIGNAEKTLNGISNPWLAPQLTAKIESLSVEVTTAGTSTRDIREVLDVLPPLLGSKGKRRYLLVFPTPAEQRGSGGVIGNFGEITADNGQLAITRFERQAVLSVEGIPLSERRLIGPADFVKRYSEWGASTTWSNINMSPDFPSVAMAMANHYPQSGGQYVDGVISADPIALAGFLRITGPIKVTDWPVPLTPENAARILLHDAYVTQGGEAPERLALLEEVALDVWSKLTTTPIADPRALVSALAPAAQGRNLQMWMRDPAEFAVLNKAGLSGAVPNVVGDSLGVITNNTSMNKIEFYLHRQITSAISVDAASGEVTSTVTIRLRNDAPTTGLPDYIIGNGLADTRVPKGSNRLHVSVYSPLRLLTGTNNGDPILATSEAELGRYVYGCWIVIPSNQTRVIELKLAGKIDVSDGYSLSVFRQPLINADDFRVVVRSTGRPLSPGKELTGSSELTGTGGTTSSESFFASWR